MNTSNNVDLGTIESIRQMSPFGREEALVKYATRQALHDMYTAAAAVDDVKAGLFFATVLSVKGNQERKQERATVAWMDEQAQRRGPKARRIVSELKEELGL